MDLALAWCAAREETLDERTYKDLGVSAFHSKNAKDGALGLLLAAIKKGEVQPGDKLLVESLDRLSRDDPVTAAFAGPFLQILLAGVWIVTLLDNKIYNLDNINEIEPL